jgi:hypothetical protein
MGLRRGKVQSISTGFYILPRAVDKISINVSSKKIRTRKKEKNKVSIKHNVPRLGLGGLRHKKRREESLSANNTERISQETVYGIDMSIFFEPIPKKIRL